jgi:hypothetical protein
MGGVRHNTVRYNDPLDTGGTVDLSAVEGEETHYGQALFPGWLLPLDG